MSGMKSPAMRKKRDVPGPKPKPKPTDKDPQKRPPRPVRVARTLPFEDYVTTLFDHHVDILARTIFLDSIHVDSDGGDSGTDSSMHDLCAKALTLLEQQDSKKLIKIVSANFGGIFDYGIGIYDRIKLSPCPTLIQGYGPIMSMGSVIFQAGDRREIAPNAIMMLHYLRGSYDMHDAVGDTSVAEHNRANELVLDLYCERIRSAGKEVDRAKLNQQMKDTLYLTATQAIDMGLADGLITRP